ncbi:hypothetical protein ACEPAF_1281 [Sanghuangporus sanghuang]
MASAVVVNGGSAISPICSSDHQSLKCVNIMHWTDFGSEDVLVLTEPGNGMKMVEGTEVKVGADEVKLGAPAVRKDSATTGQEPEIEFVASPTSFSPATVPSEGTRQRTRSCMWTTRGIDLGTGREPRRSDGMMRNAMERSAPKEVEKAPKDGS